MPDLDPEEARRRFAAGRVARLATVGESGRPHLVPVVFAVRGDEVVTAVDHKPKRPGPLARLRNVAARPAVCLLVDLYDEDWDRLWWVRADGEARIVLPDAPEEAAREEWRSAIAALRNRYTPYLLRPPAGPVIAVTIHHWHGWSATP